MTLKNKLLTWAGMLATLVVVGHYYSQPLLAQARAALVRDSDNAALQPVMLLLSSGGIYPQTFHVPPGKRLVMEYLSWRAAGVNAGLVTAQGLFLTTNGTSGVFYLPGSPVTGENIGGGRIFLIADPDTDVVYQSAGSIGTQPILVSGHFVSVP